MRFKLGDRVRNVQAMTGFGHTLPVGTEGTVMGFDGNDSSYRVNFGSHGEIWIYGSRIEAAAGDALAQARKLLEDAGYKIKALEVHKDVAWRAGDVVDYRFAEGGVWYTFVRKNVGWSGAISDESANRALAKGNLKPLLQADPADNGASVPFDEARLK